MKIFLNFFFVFLGGAPGGVPIPGGVPQRTQGGLGDPLALLEDPGGSMDPIGPRVFCYIL